MFMMIFVNDLAGAGRTVPDWMVHFSDRHPKGSGMTFVDLVFPAFLFIVGMSIPLALGGRLAKAEPVWKTLAHVAVRTLSLLFIGILMVHETPDTAALGWSGNWWCVLMYLSAIAAFCSFSTPGSAVESNRKHWQIVGWCVRAIGLISLVLLAFAFRDADGQRIITLIPFSLRTSWYGILGLIGWAYLVAALVFLVFRTNRTAILGCMVLLMCLFIADRKGLFEGFWLNGIVGIGSTLGSLPAIAVCGLLLGSMLTASESTSREASLVRVREGTMNRGGDMSSPDAPVAGLEAVGTSGHPNSRRARTSFTFWLVIGCAAAALLLNRSFGISKNSATPSWCLWSCAVTASLWYVFYLICEVHPVRFISRPLALAGQNVLLAYLISEMLPGLLDALHLGEGYGRMAMNLPTAITRSVLCGVVILFVSTWLNRIGFRLKL